MACDKNVANAVDKFSEVTTRRSLKTGRLFAGCQWWRLPAAHH
jgi:hypothetical protein